MDSDGPETQPTQQATQNVLDPRRLGKQNSGFSDDDIADIVCLLLPYSDGARAELREMALRMSQHMVDADDAAHPDLQAAEGLSLMPRLVGEHALVLRLSAPVKDPLRGFTFGRNLARCDVCFQNDPMRRLSNIHFRIYLNDYGVLMLEDSSINGTVVDGTLLKARQGDRAKTGEKKLPQRRTINPGSKIQILMHEGPNDLDFIVQIPRREGDYEETYRRNLARYMQRLEEIRAEKEPVDAAKTITAGPGGHVDLFPVNETKQPTPRARRQLRLPDDPTQEDMGRLSKEWNGSNKYNRIGRIGKGAFATVYKVTAKFDGKPYAAKELDKRKFMKNGVLDQKVENEMKIMQRVKHPNIVEYIEHIDWDDRLMIIIMEYVPYGDLGNLIAVNGPLKEEIVREEASQMLSALSYLHANNITHRDVKPDNILCYSCQPFLVKLTDFGLSKMVETEQTFLKTFCGTLLYCAPEVYNEFAEYDEYGHRHPRNRQRRRPVGQRYDHAIDIWSLGGVLYFTMTGDPPFPAKNGISYTELLHQIMTKKLNTKPLVNMNVTQIGIDFLLRLLQRRPEQRATIEELRSHPWLQGTEFSQQSNEEDVDEGLQKEASQLSLQDRDSPARISAGDDVIDEEEVLNLEQYAGEGVGGVHFDGYDSQKENYTFGQMDQQRSKLFGEVNGSAVGSAGGIPSTRLNLPDSVVSLDRTEILDPEVNDSFGSDDSTPRQTKRSQPTPRATVPAALTQSNRSASRSVDDINNMTFDPESQDLEGAESQLEHLNMKSLHPSNGLSYMSSFSTSKRKPGYDSSDEFDSTPRARPPIKKLRSDSLFGDALSWDEDSEQGLYAQIPPLPRVNSHRQIDKPVHKSTYWDARDERSWHLRYPEMTQLQHDAFASAAKKRGESFAPGKSALWDLAMKHFPPAAGQTPPPLEHGSSASDSESRASGHRSDASSDRPPSSDNAGNEDEDMPDTLPPDHGTVIPAHADPPLNRVVATFESAEGSVVSGISVPINQAMVSWGRAPENTHIYTPKTESKVPKYALKVLLWRDGYEPSKNFRPWNNAADGFYFYISTKATNGIQINKTILPSDEPKNPRAPSKNWIRLHDGDIVTFWRSGDGDEQLKAKLVFHCSWGGSSQPRATAAELVPPEAASCLDASCRKAEDRIKKLAEYDHSLEEADMDALERHRNIERERLRSQNFEAKRLEACRMLAMRASRRSSPASVSPIVPPSSAPPAIMTGVGAIPRHRSVPALKHATSGLDARALQTMAEE